MKYQILNPTRFQNTNLLTIVSVYVLILVGAIVRSQGAGMGCPDWPKCFGSYIPPMKVNELPSDYEQIFLNERLAKNQRLANILRDLGFSNHAYKVETDPNILITVPYNVKTAWIEYINRLIGVLIGIFVFFNLIFSFQMRKEDVWIPILGIGVFVLTGFQGFVGSLVVSTNLLSGFITFHMILALVIVVLLIWMRVRSLTHVWVVSLKMKWILGVFAFLLIPQIVTGSLTREQVDMLFDIGILRSAIPAELEGVFFIHRSYSWILIFLSVISFFQLRKNGFKIWSVVLGGLIGLEISLGILLTKFEFPVLAQPFHLLVALLLFGSIFYLFLRVKTVSK